jgi:hypothetical protein
LNCLVPLSVWISIDPSSKIENDFPSIIPDDDYYGPGVYGPPEGMRKSDSYRAPVHTSPDAEGHEPRLGPTRSTTVKTGVATSTVEQKSEAKFKAAQAKAKLGGVDTLTQKDIDGLSREQIKQLRGY